MTICGLRAVKRKRVNKEVMIGLVPKGCLPKTGRKKVGPLAQKHYEPDRWRSGLLVIAASGSNSAVSEL